MKQIIPEKIFVVYDAGEVFMVCAATTMDEAIKLAIRYMYAQDYTIDEFSYGESYTLINYVKIYRIGPTIKEDEGSISIMETKFYKSE